MNEISQLITNIGFPIACCLGMAWYVKYLTDKHDNEMEKMTEAINNNTIVITKLCEKMEFKEQNERVV